MSKCWIFLCRKSDFFMMSSSHRLPLKPSLLKFRTRHKESASGTDHLAMLRLEARSTLRTKLHWQLAFALSRQKHQTEIRCPFCHAKATAMDDQDMLLEKQLLRKLLIIARNLKSREGIKGAAWSNAANPRRGTGPTHREITPCAQFGDDLLQMVLRSFKRRSDS